VSIAVGLVAGVAFVRRQRRLASPLIDLGLFRARAFSAALVAYLLATFVTFGSYVFIAQYFLYFTVLVLWSPGYSPLWPLLLLASLVVVVGVGLLWARFGSNDVFSVGYRWLVAPPRPTTASSRS